MLAWQTARQHRRLSRRSFLRWAVAVAAASGGWGALLSQRHGGRAAAESGPMTRAAIWTLSGADWSSQHDQADEGSLTSPVGAAPFPFTALGAQVEGLDPGTGLPFPVEFRAHDGSTWTPWLLAPPLHDADRSPTLATDVVVVPGIGVQVRLRRALGSALPVPPERLAVIMIDSQAGPTAEEAEQASSPLAPLPSLHAAIVNPNQIGRAGWGANESYRFSSGKEIWPRRYAPARKIIVHHTATVNNPLDAAAAVRAIYYYHAVTRSWGDVGYNFLVDREGRVYEGRAGGLNAQGFPVVGGHALRYNPGSIGVALLGTFTDRSTPVPEAMLQALTNLISYQAVQHGIHPAATEFFIDRSLPNILGHRDCLQTICPGDAIYALLPTLREQALSNLPPLGQSWAGHQVPAAMLAGTTAAGLVIVRNSGSQAWSRTGSSPVRLGHRWLLPDGQEVPESGLEMHTELPKDVPPGQDVAVPVRINVPRTLSTLILRFDMVQEGVAWFSTVPGNAPLTLTVQVTRDLRYRATLPWVTRGR